MARVPAGIAASCTDTGSDSDTGAQDKVQCFPQPGVEVDFLQFADQTTFSAAWTQLTSSDETYQSGDCTSSGEIGTVTMNGTLAGAFACPSSTSNPYSLVWDSTGNLIIAAIEAPSYTPANTKI